MRERCGQWVTGGGGDCGSQPAAQMAPDGAEESGGTAWRSLAGYRSEDRGSATPEKTEQLKTGQDREQVSGEREYMRDGSPGWLE